MSEANGQQANDQQADGSLLEKSRIELSRIEGERLESYFGVSALVYNATSKDHTVTIRFTIYDGNGKQVRQGTDSITLPAWQERHVSKYWQSDFDEEKFRLPVNSWDAKIVEVK